MPFSPEDVLAALEQHLPPDARRLCVAYSGGLDSTVLLCALARVYRARNFELRAIHVDHQLHPQSTDWAEHCRNSAEALNIDLVEARVHVNKNTGEGLEAAARVARYQALRELLAPGEVLLTAHHADDQLETMLLALVRGAGPRGLSGMRRVQEFAPGWLARPLLGFTRLDLQAWASAQNLSWIADPSNENEGMDRNFLRHRVVPLLRERWPSVAASATRSGAHLSESSQLLDSLAHLDAADALLGSCLDVQRLRELDSARRRNLLRYWLRSFGVRAPSMRKLAAIEFDMLAAHEDRSPCIELERVELRRHRGLLYCGPALEHFDAEQALLWDIRETLALPASMGSLHVVQEIGRGISTHRTRQPLRVCFRRGGEVLQAVGDRHHRSLKKLLQEADILPWWRSRLPLVYAGEELAAVGDLWVNAALAAAPSEAGSRIVWRGKPQIVAQGRD